MKNTSKKSATVKSTPAKKSTSKKAAKQTKKQASAVARHRIDPQLKIVKKVSGNPRRKDTEGYKSFSLIKTGMTVEQFQEKGGRLRDLHWDIDHKNVEVKKTA